MPPDLYRRNHQDRGEHRQQKAIRHDTEQLTANKSSGQRTERHDDEEGAVLPKRRKAAVAAIACESHHHCRQD